MIAGLILVSLCWGFTNPFIKKAASNLDDITPKEGSQFEKTLAQYRHLLTSWDYLLPLFINLMGSTAYYYFLGEADLSIAVPIANSLTFALTAIGGIILGEDFGGVKGLAGIGFILMGVMLCIISKL